MFNLQLCGNRRVNAAVTFILPALWVCVQWCIKCRAVGRLDRPSHNTLHGLMPPLAGKWIKEGGGWTVCLLKINPHSSSVDHWAWQGFCLSVAARLALVRMSSSCRWFIRFTAKRWETLTQPESRNLVKGMVGFPEVRHGLIVPPKSINQCGAVFQINMEDSRYCAYFCLIFP